MTRAIAVVHMFSVHVLLQAVRGKHSEAPHETRIHNSTLQTVTHNAELGPQTNIAAW